MNVIEFIVAPDLLLFGKLNTVFACLLIIAVYAKAFLVGAPDAIKKSTDSV